jgi:Flp pilus assembly pilin Flp
MVSFIVNMWRDRRGQDMTEFALMSALVASIAAAIMPDMASIVGHVDEMLLSVLQSALGISS